MRPLLAALRQFWSDGMTAEDRHTQDAVSLCALSCPFQGYFWNVSRSDLTAILSTWDTAWRAEVSAFDRSIRVDIASTLAGGGSMCEFSFRNGARSV